MSQDGNQIRMGRAPHQAEADTFEVFDENNLSLDFEEVWTHAEDYQENRRVRTSVIQDAQVPETGENQVRVSGADLSVRDSVFDYSDRFPKSSM